MSHLLIRIKKKSDGATALSIERPDGSIAWQRQQGGNAKFFPSHDLTHYAVETVLHLRSGFYGLIAQGWDFSDFTAPYPRGPIPLEAQRAELLVGFLDVERAGTAQYSAAELNEMANQFCESHGLSACAPLSGAELSNIRKLMRDLFAGWQAIDSGQSLELKFEIGGQA